MLDNHPDLFMYPPNEFHFFKFTHNYNLGRKPKHARPDTKSFDQIIEEICTSWWFNPLKKQLDVDWGKVENVDPLLTWDEHVDINKLHSLIRASGADNYKDLFTAIVEAMASASGHPGDLETKRFACKGVQQEEFFPELKEWFPDLKMIYVLRSPYAQLNSAINNMRQGRKGDSEMLRVEYDVKRLDKSFRYPYLGPRLRQMRASYYFMRKFEALYPDQFYVLKYDDLLRKTDETIDKLCQFLDLRYADTLRELTVCGKPIRQTGWSVKEHEANKISTAPLTAWKSQLSGIAVQLVNIYFMDTLQHYGFEVEESNAPLWRRMDSSESLNNYVSNRLLFSKPVRKLI